MIVSGSPMPSSRTGRAYSVAQHAQVDARGVGEQQQGQGRPRPAAARSPAAEAPLISPNPWLPTTYPQVTNTIAAEIGDRCSHPDTAA